jgi:hypothetical protein
MMLSTQGIAWHVKESELINSGVFGELIGGNRVTGEKYF